MTLQLRMPAKLNMFLHITGRRADGYHLLQTVFRAVSLYDELTLKSTTGPQIVRVQGPAQVPPELDLTVRAATLLKAHTGFAGGAEISLHKNIPMGAGMGGGSSDAAGVLIGLNLLWRTGLSQPELGILALQLGADVPFFLRGGDQWAQGIGEELTPITLPKAYFVIVHPGVHSDTARYFNAPTLRRDCTALDCAAVLAGAPTENVFEALALREPEIAAAHQWLRQRAGNARLTGSGSALFASVADQKSAIAIQKACPNPWRAWFARSLGSSSVA
jgi:4-diphosphocytidyl-2-C-methyl-D-erythritol kinase